MKEFFKSLAIKLFNWYIIRLGRKALKRGVCPYCEGVSTNGCWVCSGRYIRKNQNAKNLWWSRFLVYNRLPSNTPK